jgi:ATP-binding cassette subfamily B protein
MMGCARALAWWIGRTFVVYHGRVLCYEIRRDLFRKWLTMSPSYFRGHSIGDLLAHALSDVEVIRMLTAMGITSTLSGLSLIIAALCLTFSKLDWRLAAAGFLPMALIPLIVRYFGPRMRRQSMRAQEALSDLSHTVEETIGGMRTIKAFGNEGVISGIFERKNETIVSERMRFVRLSSVFGAAVPFVAAASFIPVLLYGSYLTVHSEISLGNFVSFMLYLLLLRQPLEQMGQVLNVVQRASASLSRLAELLDAVPDVLDRHGELRDGTVEGRISVMNLTFRYPGADRDALKDISVMVYRMSMVRVRAREVFHCASVMRMRSW